MKDEAVFSWRVATARRSVDAPFPNPRTSRRPSVLTPTATITASEPIRPASRTLR